MKWRTIFTTALTLGLLGYAAPHIHRHFRARFTAEHIGYQHVDAARWQLDQLSETDRRNVERILDQEFYFLGEGCQSFVFGSQDGQYVLKFMKLQRVCPSFWMEVAQCIPAVRAWRSNHIAKRQIDVEWVYTGWHLATTQLPERCGIIFTHLNSSPGWPKPVRLTTKNSDQLVVSLEKVPFMIQKRAQPFPDAIMAHVKQGQLKEAKKLLDDLIDFVLCDYADGIADRDWWAFRNSGLVDGKLIHIDVGLLVANPTACEFDVYGPELYNKCWKACDWLSTVSPELAAHVEQRARAELGQAYSKMRLTTKSPICHCPIAPN